MTNKLESTAEPTRESAQQKETGEKTIDDLIVAEKKMPIATAPPIETMIGKLSSSSSLAYQIT